MMLKGMFDRGGRGGLMVVLNRGRMLFFISHDGFRARLSVRDMNVECVRVWA